MKETICTIPINDIFGPKEGCPVCRMHDMLEQKYVEYITGAAMMEPDVRTETNHKGFCHTHYEKMLQCGKRLQNALILESHLQQLITTYFPEKIKGKPDKKQLSQLQQMQHSCFVCDKIAWAQFHMFETVFHSFENDPAFRRLYSEQPYICLPHYTQLMQAATAKNGIGTKALGDFYQQTAALAGNYMKMLKKDISHFCSMYDYRNRGGDWGNAKDAIERSVLFLTAEPLQTGDA